tara:strand:+ start:805 stop:1062 length:258 start_codon:yes stop_codon:yes gene_type:complete
MNIELEYKKRWYNLRSKLNSLLHEDETMGDLDPVTLKVALEIMNILDNNKTKKYDYNIPKYFQSDCDIKITHEEISELFNRERKR